MVVAKFFGPPRNLGRVAVSFAAPRSQIANANEAVDVGGATVRGTRRQPSIACILCVRRGDAIMIGITHPPWSESGRLAGARNLALQWRHA